MGTYSGTEIHVIVKEKKGIIEIYSLQDELICSHLVSLQKGQTISNTNHKRDTSKSLDEMMNKAADCFSNSKLALNYFHQIQKKFPRYTRDHLQIILKSLTDVKKNTADKTLDFCLKNNVLSGIDFEQVFHVLLDGSTDKKSENKIKLLNNDNLEKANETPQKSDIKDYENILNQRLK